MKVLLNYPSSFAMLLPSRTRSVCSSKHSWVCTESKCLSRGIVVLPWLSDMGGFCTWTLHGS